MPKKTVRADAKPSPAASATPTTGAKGRKAGAGHHPGASPSPGPTVTGSSAAASGGVGGGTRCAPGGIVLSLFSGMPSYGQHALPTFSVYAVSTSASACTLSYGPGSVQVVVTRHGHVIWDSAACKPPAARPTRFTLGVPQVLAITWNRQARKPVGCAGSLPAGAWGTFDAVAMSAGQTSPVRSFKISP